MNKKIGMIGLGTMGMGIAKNLLARGYAVTGYDIDSAKGQQLAQLGGTPASSPAQAAADAQAIILMVFNGDQVYEALFGEGGAAASMTKGSAVIVCASVGYEACEAIDERLSALGLHLIDAPVRGTAASATTGALYLMVGARPSAYTAHKALLNELGSTVVCAGEVPGMGQKAKTCMQAFFSLMFEGTYELLALGTAAGLAPRVVFDILNDTGASNNIFRATARNVAARQFSGTANPLSILEKDMKIACSTAHAFGLVVPALEGVSENFSKSMDQFADEDVWAAMKTIEQPIALEVKFDYPQD